MRRPSNRIVSPSRSTRSRSFGTVSCAVTSWTTLYETGTKRAGVVGQRRFGHQDERFPAAQAIDHFGRGLPPRKLAEELFDVLDLEGAGFNRVLLDEVFHRRTGDYRADTPSPGERIQSRGEKASLRSRLRQTQSLSVIARGARPSPASRQSSASTAGKQVVGSERGMRGHSLHLAQWQRRGPASCDRAMAALRATIGEPVMAREVLIAAENSTANRCRANCAATA